MCPNKIYNKFLNRVYELCKTTVLFLEVETLFGGHLEFQCEEVIIRSAYNYFRIQRRPKSTQS